MNTGYLNLASTTLPLAWQVVFFLITGGGVVLWVLGRKMARACCAVSGLSVGGVAGVVTAQYLHFTELVVMPTLACVVLGAVLGCVLAWWMFRLWMGLVLASLFAVLTPVVYLASAGHPLPFEPQQQVLQLIDLTRNQPEATTPDQVRAGSLREFCDLQVKQTQDWWEELVGSGQQAVIIAGGGGALVGLACGLIGPLIGASVASAMIGGGMFLLFGKLLLNAYLPQTARWVEAGPVGTPILLGLITALGVLIQWTISRRATDSE